MVAILLPIILIAVLISISAGIGYLCLEFVIRLIGRGLGVDFARVDFAHERAARMLSQQ